MRIKHKHQPLLKLSYLAVATVTVFAFAWSLRAPTLDIRADALSEIGAKINAIKREIAEYERKSKELGEQSISLANEIAKLQNEEETLQKKIDLSQLRLNQLANEIAINTKKIQDNRDALGRVIVDQYLQDKVTLIERLAGSDNLSKFIDEEAQTAIASDSLARTVKEIQALKAKLEQDEVEEKKVKNDLDNQKKQLVNTRVSRQSLLNATKNQRAAYDKLASKNKGQMKELERQQAAIREAMNNSNSTVTIVDNISGGYPWNDSNCPMWGMYSTGGADGNGGDGRGYGCRQCASYAAWRMAKETNVYPRWGNANQFPSHARAAGYSTGSAPRAKSLGVISAGAYGHVVYIEGQTSDGRWIVAEYNNYLAGGWGLFMRSIVSNPPYDTYIYL